MNPVFFKEGPMDEFRVADLSPASLEAFDGAACWAVFLDVPIFQLRISVNDVSIKDALAWYKVIRALPLHIRATLEGNVSTAALIVWLAAVGQRIDPDCRVLRMRDPNLDGPTFMDAFRVLKAAIPCTDRERADGWNGRQAMEMVVGPTVILGPQQLHDLFCVPLS